MQRRESQKIRMMNIAIKLNMCKRMGNESAAWYREFFAQPDNH